MPNFKVGINDFIKKMNKAYKTEVLQEAALEELKQDIVGMILENYDQIELESTEDYQKYKANAVAKGIMVPVEGDGGKRPIIGSTSGVSTGYLRETIAKIDIDIHENRVNENEAIFVYELNPSDYFRQYATEFFNKLVKSELNHSVLYLRPDQKAEISRKIKEKLIRKRKKN